MALDLIEKKTSEEVSLNQINDTKKNHPNYILYR